MVIIPSSSSNDWHKPRAYVGPLNDRAAGPGYRLFQSERRPEDLEDMLYTAAIQAGWLAGGPNPELVQHATVRWPSVAAWA
jgi:hypothetical protein